MSWDGFEKVIWWGRFEKDLRRYSDWEGPPCICWDGFEKVFLLRRTWEAWNYYRVVEMDLRRWDESEKEMYPPELSLTRDRQIKKPTLKSEILKSFTLHTSKMNKCKWVHLSLKNSKINVLKKIRLGNHYLKWKWDLTN